jgi:fructokinase
MAIAAIEAGGTKFLCAVFDEDGAERDRARIPTEDPETTLSQVAGFFRPWGEVVTSMGIGAFGPVDVDPASDRYGTILQTPKTAWIGVNLRRELQESLPVPVSVETDVNVAALAEAEAAGATVRSLVYMTVGTGVGVGIALEGHILPLRRHPEIGHMFPRRSADETSRFEGICPYHGDCLEGVASGPAMRARWGRPAEELPPEHEAWDVEAEYIAQSVATLLLSFAPDRLVLGGGVMAQRGLLGPVRDRAHGLLGGYLEYVTDRAVLDRIVVPQTLGGDAGIRGAYLLGRQHDRSR